MPLDDSAPQGQPDIAAQIEAARKAGYSDGEIGTYLQQTPTWGAKFDAARKAGYSDSEIYGHLGLKYPQPENAPLRYGRGDIRAPEASTGPDEPPSPMSLPARSPGNAYLWPEDQRPYIAPPKASIGPSGEPVLPDEAYAPKPNPLLTMVEPGEPEQIQQQSYPQALASSLARGAVSGTASVVGAAASKTGAYGQRMLTLFDAADKGGIPPMLARSMSANEKAELTDYQRANPATKLALRQAMGQAVTAGTPNAEGVPPVQQRMEKWVEKTLPVANEQEGFGTSLARGIGGFGPALAAGAVSGPVGAGMVMWAQAYDSTKADALQHGATPEQAERAAQASAATQAGMLALPISHALNAVPAALKGDFVRTLAHLASRFGEGAIFNSAATIADNFIAQHTYDPSRPLMKGVGEAAATGAVMTGAVPAVHAIGQGIVRTGRAAVEGGAPPETPAAPLAPTPAPAAPTPGKVAQSALTDIASGKPGEGGEAALTAMAQQGAQPAPPAPEAAAQPAAAPAASAETAPSAAAPPAASPKAAPVPPAEPTPVDIAAAEAKEPTPAQAQAGNYKKGYPPSIGGLNVAVETPVGATRKGPVDEQTGQPAWESPPMAAHYGHILGTKGADGDPLDVFLGPYAHEAEKHPAFVIDQIDPATGKFDEHKTLVGFPDERSAVAAYTGSFSDGSGYARLGAISEMPFDQFKDWTKNGNTTEALAYHPPFEWATAKVGDRLPDGRGVIVGKGMTKKADAQALADREGGSVWIDGPRKWAVVVPERETPPPTAEPEKGPPAEETPTGPLPYDRVPNEPERLSSFIRRIGGMRDDGGDIRSTLGGGKYRPGLVRKDGLPDDAVALRAWEAGYFPELGEQRPSINDLREALDDDLKGRPRYSSQDEAALQAYRDAMERNSEIDRLAVQYGIPTRGLTQREFYDRLAEHVSFEQAAQEAAALAAAHEEDYAELERRTREWMARNGATLPVDESYTASAPRTLEDLENEHQQEEATRAAGQGPGARQEPEPASQPPGAGEANGGPGGRGTGVGRGPEAPATDLLGRPVEEPKAAGQRAPTIRNDERQTLIPGTEPSAVQAQAARDAVPNTGRVPQAKADEGLFAPDTSGQGELPATQPAAARPADANGNPIFQKGERVVTEDGHHGTVDKAIVLSMQSVLGGEKSLIHSYEVKTDRGRTVVTSKLQPESGEAPGVVPDPVYKGTPIDPEVLAGNIAYAMKRAREWISSAGRAIKPDRKASFRRLAEDEEKKAAEGRAVLDAWKAKYPEEAERLFGKLETPAVPAVPTTSDTGFRIVETKHTKTGEPLWSVSLNDRVEAERFRELSANAKRAGGYWSRYAKDGAVPGFQFKSRDAALRFVRENAKAVERAEAEEAKTEAKPGEKPEGVQPPTQAQRRDAVWWAQLPRERREAIVKEAADNGVDPAAAGWQWTNMARDTQVALMEASQRLSAGEAAPKIERPEEKPPEAAPERPADYGAGNKLFTADAAEAARARLRERFNRLNAGFDPQMMLDGLTLAGFHIEAGARKFADYASAMIEDLGDGVRPFLSHFYGAVRDFPGFDNAGMDTPETVAAELKQMAEGTTSEAEARDAEQRLPGVGEPGNQPVRPGTERAPRQPEGNGPAPVLEAGAPEDDGGTGRPGTEAGVRPGAEGARGNRPLFESGAAGTGRGGAGGEGVAPDGAGERAPDTSAVRPNFHVSDPTQLIGGTPKQRFARNRAAVEALHAIQAEGREPTPEELQAMAGYTGWGSFGQQLFQGSFENAWGPREWREEAKWLRDHLGKERWEDAQRSIINAHYTDPPTVQTVWNMLQKAGFTGGRVLEPSMGIGNFFGMMPREVMDRSNLTGIELDGTTAAMAKLLYPQAGVHNMGYQESHTPDNFYDLVLGNWPFAAQSPADRRYDKLSPTLHDYFFLKALDQTRPGGLVAGITATGTMDKASRAVRTELAKKADLVAAFRLPSGAFQDYAGTNVVTDLLVFRKRAEPNPNAAGEPWVNSKDVELRNGTIRLNNYWTENPENVLGTLDWGHGTTSGRPGMIVHRPEDYEARLAGIADKIPEDAYRPIERGNEPRFITNNTADRQMAITIGPDGKLYQVSGEKLARLEDVAKGTKFTPKVTDQINRAVGLRRAYGALIDAERAGDPQTEDLRRELRDQFEAYREKHGRIADSQAVRIMQKLKDPFWPQVAALERSDGTPSRILTEPTVRATRSIENPSISDAYIMARNAGLHFDMDKVAELARVPREQAEQELLRSGAVMRTPGGGFEPSESYLSGNVRRKLREAQAALKNGEDMQASVDALTESLPPTVPYYNIEAKFGAPWIDNDTYKHFIGDMLGMGEDQLDDVHVRFAGGRWRVTLDRTLNNRAEATGGKFGTPYYRFQKLIEAALSNRTVKIESRDADGNKYVDEEKTKEANDKAAAMREAFSDWAWQDAERKIKLENAYNEVMNAIAKPRYDGSFMDMSGMALHRGEEPLNLRQHQLNAIWRGVHLGRGLFAHEVGTGKAGSLDSKLLTPKGWVRMGDIRVGDLVITQDGSATKVEAIFPQGEKEIFRVTFSDGASTECCDEHLWLTQTYRERIAAVNESRLGRDWPSAKAKVRPLSEIRTSLVAPHLGAKNHSIPVVDPVLFDEQDVPLDPYFLGALLGDGHIGNGVVSFSKPDRDIVAAFNLPDGVRARELPSDGCCPTWNFIGTVPGHNPLLGAVRELGLESTRAATKFIPDIYKFNRVEVRLAVLRGLMDTDGFVSRKGTEVAISTASVRLADDITFLVRSLGGITKRTVKSQKYTYKGEVRKGAPAFILSVCLPPDINPFLLARKADRVVPKTKYLPTRYIVGVESIGMKLAQCIRVSHPSRLYVTDDFIVTHNTYTMGGIAVEGRRYGVFRKPLVLAHNANSKAVAREIQSMYPGARIHYVDNLSPETIKPEMQRIANEDWDAIVMPHSLLDRLALKRDTLMELASDEIAELEQEAMEAAREDNTRLTPEMMDNPDAMKKVRSVTAKQLVKQRETIKANIEKQANRVSKEGAISFEDLGIDGLLVDEAHEFKKPPIRTKMQLKGLNTGTSQRSIALNFLSGYLGKRNSGKGVYLFTGTPITNSLNEIFNLSRYFMRDTLDRDGIGDWDTWFNTFAGSDNDIEYTADGSIEPVTRLSSFVNTDELVRLMSEFTDVVRASQMPEFVKRESPEGRTENPVGRPYKQVINDVAEMSPRQKEILAELQERARQFKAMSRMDRKKAMLSGDERVPIRVETDAANASLDARMFDPDAGDHADSKVNRVVRNVLAEYQTPGAGQAIFVDRGYGAVKSSEGRANRFVLIKDLVDKLVAGGIPRDEIAIVSGGTTPERKAQISDDMNTGAKRVVIGLSDTLGVGVNMQRQLRAMHHMDAPWRPGDLEQRNGRGERQGNEWNTVKEYRYITEGIDNRRWQRLASKDRFIRQFIDAFNDTSGRRIGTIEGDAADISDSPDILKTLSEAAGDPRILVREKIKGDIGRLERRERAHTQGAADAARQARNLRAYEIEEREQQAKREAQLATWEQAQARADAAAKAAGETKKLYEVQFPGDEEPQYLPSAEIQDRLDTAYTNIARGDLDVPMMALNGYTVSGHWRTTHEQPYLSMKDGDGNFVANPNPAMASILSTMTARKAATVKGREPSNLANRIASLERASKEAFPRATDLEKKRQQLAMLEADLQANPKPAPAWLRNGAPIDSEIYVNGEPRVVRGHRMTEDGYTILTDEGEVPYLEATDENGRAKFQPAVAERDRLSALDLEGEPEVATPKPSGRQVDVEPEEGGTTLYSFPAALFDPNVWREAFKGVSEINLRKSLGLAQSRRDNVGLVRGAVDDVHWLFSPTSRGQGAKEFEHIIRRRASMLARSSDQSASALDEFARKIDRLPVEQQLAITDRVERGEKQPIPELQEAMGALKAEQDKWLRKIQSIGRLKDVENSDDYMGRIYSNYHEWKAQQEAPDAKTGESRAVGAAMSKRPIRGRAGFLKQRSFDTLADAMAAGLKPVTTNPIRMQLLKLREMQKFYHGTRMADDMKASGIAMWVPGAKRAQAEAQGLVELKDPYFQPKIPAARFGDNGPPPNMRIDPGGWYAPEPAARIFNNYVSRGPIGSSTVIDLVRRAGNMLNSAQLGLSGFHATFVTLDSMISHAALGLQQAMRAATGHDLGNMTRGETLRHGLATMASTPIAPVTTVRAGAALRRAWLDPANATPEMQRLADMLNAGGGRISMDKFYRSTDSGAFFKSWRDVTDPRGALHEAWQMVKDTPLSAPFKIAGRVMDTMMEPLMGHLVPRMKLGVFAAMARDYLERHPDATPEEATAEMTKAWDSVENRLGQMTYDNVFWHKVVKDTAFLMTRSVGWNLGTIREIAGSGVDGTRMVRDLAAGKAPDFTARMAYTVMMPVVTGVLGAILTYAMTGQGPTSLLDYFYPPTGTTTNGEKDRVSIPGYIKDVVAYQKAPVQTVLNKLQPLLEAEEEVRHNRDYYGGIIYDPERDPSEVGAYAEYLLNQSLPFSIRAMMKNRQQGQSLGAQALSFWGIQPAPQSVINPEREKAWQERQNKAAYRKRLKENAQGRWAPFTGQ